MESEDAVDPVECNFGFGFGFDFGNFVSAIWGISIIIIIVYFNLYVSPRAIPFFTQYSVLGFYPGLTPFPFPG